MSDYILYLLAMVAFAVLVISLEWEKVKGIDAKTTLTILVILFFLGSAISSLFA